MKTQAATTQERPCFECDGGILLPVREPFTTRTPEGLEITIPDVPMERCNRCGETVLSGEAAASISNDIRVLMADPGAFEILKARKWAAGQSRIAS